MPAESMPHRPLSELQPKAPVHGRVTRLAPYGAYADIGSDQEGLLHISRLRREKVNRVEDVLQVGQEFDGWVHAVDAASGRLDLTLLEPLGIEWNELRPGVRLRGKVIRLEPFGAFVDIGAERAGLVHVSELGAGRMADPADVVSVGEEVEVTVLEVNRAKRQIRLSMKEAFRVEEPGEPPAPTAMELALRQALEGGGTPASSTGAPRPVGSSRRSEQEEILARTLRDKLRTRPPSESAGQG